MLFGQGQFLSPHLAKTQLSSSLTDSIHPTSTVSLVTNTLPWKEIHSLQKFGVGKNLFKRSLFICSPRLYLIRNAVKPVILKYDYYLK